MYALSTMKVGSVASILAPLASLAESTVPAFLVAALVGGVITLTALAVGVVYLTITHNDGSVFVYKLTITP